MVAITASHHASSQPSPHVLIVTDACGSIPSSCRCACVNTVVILAHTPHNPWHSIQASSFVVSLSALPADPRRHRCRPHLHHFLVLSPSRRCACVRAGGRGPIFHSHLSSLQHLFPPPSRRSSLTFGLPPYPRIVLARSISQTGLIAGKTSRWLELRSWARVRRVIPVSIIAIMQKPPITTSKAQLHVHNHTENLFDLRSSTSPCRQRQRPTGKHPPPCRPITNNSLTYSAVDILLCAEHR